MSGPDSPCRESTLPTPRRWRAYASAVTIKCCSRGVGLARQWRRHATFRVWAERPQKNREYPERYSLFGF